MLFIKRWRLIASAILVVVYALVLWRDPETTERPSWAQSVDFGYTPDPEGAAEFLESLEVRFFSDAAPDAMNNNERRDVFLHKAMHEASRARYGKQFKPGRQLNGSCVAWGAAHAVYCSEAVEWQLGNRADPPIMPATESIYGGSRVESKRREDYDGEKPVGGWSYVYTG